MQALDLLVIAAYVVGLIAVGSVFARRMRSMREMFAAGGQSPWWLSGLSGFMTMFSAGTFVVWGGISYRFGLVGVSICMMLGFSALLVGWLLAGVWKSQGIDSAAEFLELRFGKSIVQFYMWLQGALGIFTMGGSVYALALIICTLVPLSPHHPLADPATGNLSVPLTSIVICLVVIVICFIGGLWAVLVTDVLQFIILTTSVAIVVPLLFSKAGGVAAFVDRAPEGFLRPTHGEFTWWFLAGWIVIHFFKIGGEWAFVQRFTCVPTPRDARKSAFIFGAMYLVSPLIWMLPPMIYRTINPDADHEQAYVLACRYVLPAGLVGLMVAAMSSATASTATTVLNVYAGAFTQEFYQRFFRPAASERELVLVGRLITLALGSVTLAGSLLIPRMGSYTGWILSTTAMLSAPLVLPTIWGLFSHRIGLRTAWTVTLVSAVVGLLIKFGLSKGGWFDGTDWLSAALRLAQANSRVTEIVVGVATPLMLLALAEWVLTSGTHPGWDRVEARRQQFRVTERAMPSRLPARLCGWSIAALSLLIAMLVPFDREQWSVLVTFAVLLGAVGFVILWLSRDPGGASATHGRKAPAEQR